MISSLTLLRNGLKVEFHREMDVVSSAPYLLFDSEKKAYSQIKNMSRRLVPVKSIDPRIS